MEEVLIDIKRVVDQERCLGCTACYAICPQKAIQMTASKKGFYIPIINEEVCVDCGLCANVCTAITPMPSENTEQLYFAVKHKNYETRAKSTSGGAFAAIVEAVPNATVYGAASVENKIIHIRIENNDISAIHGSKYVISDVGENLKLILADLKRGRWVIFSGTPCQCGGVKKYLIECKAKMEKLLLVDFICHGACSPLLFSEYINFCEKKSNRDISEHVFRSKIKGWHAHTEGNIFDCDNQDVESFYSQLHRGMFYSALPFRESCYHCQYANTNRISDITIGDFWGIEHVYPRFDDNRGVSLVVLNSEKSLGVFEQMKPYLNWLPSTCRTAVDAQPHLKGTVERPAAVDAFWNDYYHKGFSFIAHKYFGAGKLKRTISKLLHNMVSRK